MFSAHDCWPATAWADHVVYFDAQVRPALTGAKNILGTAIHDLIIQEYDLIRDGNEADFRKIQSKLSALLHGKTERAKKKIHTKLTRIFDYKAFSRKQNNGWGAYRLCEQAAVLTCPYCNLAYGHTVFYDKEGVMRPTLDHFLDKGKFPLFALSLNNLVPSCYYCNSSIKGKKDFMRNLHLHPLHSADGIEITFDVCPRRARRNSLLIDTAALKLRVDPGNRRAVNSLKTFHLQDRYECLLDEARFIAKRMIEYTQGTNPGLREWAMRGVTKDNYRNRVLGKLIFDFAKVYT